MTLSRAWYGDVDVALADFSTAAKACHSVLHARQAVLTGLITGTHGANGAAPGTSNGTMRASSNGTVASAGNNLGGAAFTDANWVRAAAGNPHTWFTIDFTSGLSVCFDYSLGTDPQCDTWFALTPFSTGGTTSARPTSTTEWRVQGASSAEVFWTNNAQAGKVHFARDAEGGFYSLVSQTSQAGGPGSTFGGYRLANPCAADLAPFASHHVNGFGTGVITNAGQVGSSMGGRNAANNASVSLQFAGMITSAGAHVEASTALNADGLCDTDPVNVEYTTGGNLGSRKGRMPDALWGRTLGTRQEPTVGNIERCLFQGIYLPFPVFPTI